MKQRVVGRREELFVDEREGELVKLLCDRVVESRLFENNGIADSRVIRGFNS